MSKLIDGKAIARKIEVDLIEKVEKLKNQGITPKLAVILVGNDKPSLIYVGKKEESAKKIGIDFELHKIKEEITTEELVKKIIEIQEDKDLSGVIIQLPLPKHIETTPVLEAVKQELDVDYLIKENQEKLKTGENDIIPPTPGAIMKILEELKVNLKNKKIAVIGKGALVGKPIANILKNQGSEVTICDSKTKNTKEICLDSDIIITGVGKKDMIRGDMIKKGAIVIDAGTSFIDGKLYGDVNVEEALKNADFVTPAIGGVGPITVMMLLWNTVENAKKL